MCRHLNVPLTVIDVGVNGGEGMVHPGPENRENPDVAAVQVLRRPVADMLAGDLRTEDAMTPEVFSAAWHAGRQAVAELASDVRVLVLGEMGIGNTTAAAAVLCGLTGQAPSDVVGRGTGVDDAGRARKVAVVEDAVGRVGGANANGGHPILAPLECLRRLGGREMAALAGAAAEAASRRIAVLVDGFIVTSALAALVARAPLAAQAMVLAHRSREPGHQSAWRILRDAQKAASSTADGALAPLLDLNLALGEGTGALAALPLVDLAVATHGEMATFEQAAVPNKDS